MRLRFQLLLRLRRRLLVKGRLRGVGWSSRLAWKMRWALHETAENHDAHARLLIAVAMAVVFGYFCVSSFVKANRRSRA